MQMHSWTLGIHRVDGRKAKPPCSMISHLQEGGWRTVFDGLFFIRKNYPVDR